MLLEAKILPLFLVFLASSTLLGQSVTLNEQSVLNVIPPSPNVAAFNKYVDLPVSYYTGTPQISIPLYEIKTNQLSLPISLSYHASGIKVEENASWVGAGWTLNAGGAISRTVKGLPDEYLAYGTASTASKKGYFYTPYLFTSAGPNSVEMLDCSVSVVTSEGHPINRPDSLAQGFLDMEPDLFHYNFPGGSGKFSFDQDQEIYKITIDDIKFESHPFSPTLPGYASPTDFQWILKDTYGVSYTFSKAERIEATGICGTQDSPYQPSIDFYQSSWHLTEMSYENEWIRFEYANETLTYDTKITESGSFPVYGASVGTPPPPGNGGISYCRNETTVFAKRLSKILSSQGTVVEFIAKTSGRTDLSGSRALDSIIVSKNGESVKKFKLATFYNTKLMLEEVYQVSPDNGTPLNGHQFQYFPGTLPGVNSNQQDYWGFYNGKNNGSLIPPYRNATYHVNRNSTTDRSPDLNYAQMGALKKIIYPTGGSTEFMYELHEYYAPSHQQVHTAEVSASGGTISNPVSDTFTFTVPYDSRATFWQDSNPVGEDNFRELRKWNGSNYVIYTPPTSTGRTILTAGDYELYAENANGGETFLTIEYDYEAAANVSAGGLRLKYMSFGQTAKYFHYKTDENVPDSGPFFEKRSSGVLFTPILLGGHLTTNVAGTISGGEEGISICSDVATTTSLSVATHSQIPMAVYHNNHVGYSQVEVYEIAPSLFGLFSPENANPNGYTEYTFINTASPETGFPYMPQKDLSHKNGKLISEKLFDSNGNTLKETINYYSDSISTERVISAKLQYLKTKTCYECTSVNFQTNYFSLYPSWNKLDSTVTKNHAYSQLLTQVERIGYDPSVPRSHHMYVSKAYQDSHGATIENRVQRSVGRPGLITQSATYRNNEQISGEALTYVGKLPLTYAVWDNASDSYQQAKEYTYVDNRVVKASDKNGVNTTQQFKSYRYQNVGDTYLVIAEVVNGEANETFYTSFEDTGTASGSTKTGAKRYEFDPIVNNDQFTITGFSPANPGNLVMSYWYYKGGQWHFKSVPYSSTITESGADALDEVRVHPKDAQMITYTYDQKYRVASQTDENNVSTFYDYDDFDRLIAIWDEDRNIVKEFMYHLADPN